MSDNEAGVAPDTAWTDRSNSLPTDPSGHPLPRSPQVVVSVGTDHHPFDRLIDWIDTWTAVHRDVEVLVQRGSSRPPRTAGSVDLMGHPDLLAAMTSAQVVVVQGGPAGMADASDAGHRPVVVPRRPDLGEHVDGHQVTFARWMADRDRIELAEDEATLHRLLDEAIANPRRFRVEAKGDTPSDAVAAFASIVDPLFGSRRPSRLSRGR